MEVDKEPKKTEFIDINQTMNSLLTKVADAIGGPSEETEKNLVEIRNYLADLVPVDKTVTYVLTEETIQKVDKALRSVELPEDKQLKEIGIDLSTPERTFKTDVEVPVTEDGAREKVNVEVNAGIEKTIKAIDNVIEIVRGEAKGDVSVPETDEKASKVLSDILLTLLAKSLKNVTSLEFPDGFSEKNSEEIDMDAIKGEKNSLRVNPLATLSEKEANPVAPPNTLEVKEDNPIGNPIGTEDKIPLGIGVFPGMEDKEDSIIPADDIGVVTEKEEQEIGSIEASEKEEVLLEAADDGSDKSNVNIIAPVKGEEKPRTPDEWYKAWGWPANDNSLNNQQFSLFGANIPLGDQFRRGIGSTLSFFGITSADVGMFINSQRRYINTVTNAFELSVQMQAARVQGTIDKEGERIFNKNEIVDRIFEMLDNREIKNTLTLEDLPTEQFERLNRPISERGKTNGEARTDEDGFSLDGNDVSELIMTRNDRDSLDVGSGLSFGSVYKQRTFEIQQDAAKRGTGWFRVYTRRGPKFENSQEEVKIIPFQFEPTISGDSKSTEYATISTLGRSQAAQVYKRSSERTISMSLDYVVVNPPTNPNDDRFKEHINQARNDAGQSLATQDMTNWTEDYIYNYVIRNMRNLTLPNLIGPRYKLAPPIVQVWYGGLDAQSASSTGGSGDAIADEDNSAMPDVFPTFRTNWFDSSGSQRQYRSLWVVKSVSFDYKGGKINRNSRNNVWVTAEVSLTEIAPSVTDNEVLLWSKIS